ncbi:phosphoribosylaminoimidazole-succinocarboxamide synthase [Bradyrhizobium sp. LM6.10]
MSSFRCRNRLIRFPVALSGAAGFLSQGLAPKVLPMTTMLSSDLPLPKIGRGKVRDIYAIDDDRLLLVTTDRISAFDVVMGETIPMKGAVLTQVSAFWFNELEGVVPHHMISADTDEIIAAIPALKPHRAEILGRAMLCRRTTVFPIECVIRGYLSGSAWKEYAGSGTLAGEKLKAGLVESEKLEPAIFSPATKAETGHDENITIAKMREVVGDETAYTLESMTRAIYTLGEELAREQGIIIADTKFEFGRDKDGRIILIDEVMTPDSSRFWAVDAYKPGQPQASFDKQPLRDYLDIERRAGRWNGDAPPPPLPASVVEATSKRYLEAYRRVTGTELKI